MFKLLATIASAVLGIFSTGCTAAGGDLRATFDGVDVDAAANGHGGVSLTLGNEIGSVTLSGQLGHHPEILSTPPTTQPAASPIAVDVGK